MRVAWPWAIAGGLLLGGVAGWWSLRESPEQRQARQVRATRAAAADAKDAGPALYRWEDERGTVHYSDQAPRGRKYRRIEREPEDGIEVHGDRQ